MDLHPSGVSYRGPRKSSRGHRDNSEACDPALLVQGVSLTQHDFASPRPQFLLFKVRILLFQGHFSGPPLSSDELEPRRGTEVSSHAGVCEEVAFLSPTEVSCEHGFDCQVRSPELRL